MFKKILDNPEKTVFGKIRNIGFVFGFNLVWLCIVAAFLKAIMPQEFYTFINSINYTTDFGNNIIAAFFFLCVSAPLWEEAAFRYAPITIAKNFGSQFYLPVIILSSVLFGWGHGSGPISLLIQGVGGFTFSLLYIKNNFSYWSSVSAHFLWNFSLSFLLPILVGI